MRMRARKPKSLNANDGIACPIQQVEYIMLSVRFAVPLHVLHDHRLTSTVALQYAEVGLLILLCLSTLHRVLTMKGRCIQCILCRFNHPEHITEKHGKTPISEKVWRYIDKLLARDDKGLVEIMPSSS